MGVCRSDYINYMWSNNFFDKGLKRQVDVETRCKDHLFCEKCKIKFRKVFENYSLINYRNVTIFKNITNISSPVFLEARLVTQVKTCIF